MDVTLLVDTKSSVLSMLDSSNFSTELKKLKRRESKLTDKKKKNAQER